jgi:hypothetical protein
LRVGVLDQGTEQRPLCLQSGAVDVGLDGMREVLVLRWQGEGELEVERDRDGLLELVDGLEGDGSLGVVGGAHGRSP